MFFADTHAHIYAEAFKKDRSAILANAFSNDVKHIYMPNIDHTSIDGMLELEAQYPKNCFAMMGLHPCHVQKDFEKELYLVENWLSKRKFVAVGEIGLDLHWDKSTLDWQKEAFKIQIEWACKYDLPIIIHAREAFQEIITILKESKKHFSNLKGIFHCFSGNLEEAKEVLVLGNFYLGIGGVVTFKNGGLDAVLPHIDLKHLVLETDSPYLAPIPYRGKRNEPSYIPLIAEKIASLKRVSLEEVKEACFHNTHQLFI